MTKKKAVQGGEIEKARQTTEKKIGKIILSANVEFWHMHCENECRMLKLQLCQRPVNLFFKKKKKKKKKGI